MLLTSSTAEGGSPFSLRLGEVTSIHLHRWIFANWVHRESSVVSRLHSKLSPSLASQSQVATSRCPHHTRCRLNTCQIGDVIVPQKRCTTCSDHKPVSKFYARHKSCKSSESAKNLPEDCHTTPAASQRETVSCRRKAQGLPISSLFCI